MGVVKKEGLEGRTGGKIICWSTTPSKKMDVVPTERSKQKSRGLEAGLGDETNHGGQNGVGVGVTPVC